MSASFPLAVSIINYALGEQETPGKVYNQLVQCFWLGVEGKDWRENYYNNLSNLLHQTQMPGV